MGDESATHQATGYRWVPGEPYPDPVDVKAVVSHGLIGLRVKQIGEEDLDATIELSERQAALLAKQLWSCVNANLADIEGEASDE